MNEASLILLFLACTVLLLAYHFFLSRFIGIPAHVIIETPHKALTHTKLLNLFVLYGFELSEGVCFGVSVLWASLFLLDGENELYEQLDALRRYQDCLDTKLHQINAYPITREDMLLLNLKRRITQILQIQSPEAYPNIYQKYIWQEDIDVILDSINGAHNKVTRQLMHTHAFKNKTQAREIFSQLLTSLRHFKFVLLLSSQSHTIAMTLQGNHWLILNTNTLYQQNLKHPYLLLNTNNMVNYLYDKFSAKFSRRLILSMDFISQKNSPIHPQIKWLETIEPQTEMCIEPDNNRLSFMSIAAIQGDVTSLRQGISRGWGAFFHYHTSDDSPITLTITQGRTAAFIELLNSAPKQLNRQRRIDKKTLLHLAVFYHATDIVIYLLGLKNINIDMTDNGGMTPLMLACTTTESKTDITIIRLLLINGASKNLKSIAGKTAQNYAEANDNLLAIRCFTNPGFFNSRPSDRQHSVSDNVCSVSTSF